jgi:hypothetical protein
MDLITRKRRAHGFRDIHKWNSTYRKAAEGKRSRRDTQCAKTEITISYGMPNDISSASYSDLTIPALDI